MSRNSGFTRQFGEGKTSHLQAPLPILYLAMRACSPRGKTSRNNAPSDMRATGVKRCRECAARYASGTLRSSSASQASALPSEGARQSPLAEIINGLYKAELIHRRSWKSFEPVELATLTWVDWFNNRRILEPIGNIPPAEAEKQFYEVLESQPMAA